MFPRNPFDVRPTRAHGTNAILMTALMVVASLAVLFLTIPQSSNAALPDGSRGTLYEVDLDQGSLSGTELDGNGDLVLNKVSGEVPDDLSTNVLEKNILFSGGALSHDFVDTFGGPGGEWAYSVVRISDGGYAAIGETYTNTAGQYGFSDMWLLRLDQDGHELWNRSYGGEGPEIGYDLVELPGGDLALTGSKRYVDQDDKDIWLVVTDPAGNELWSKEYNLGGDEKPNGITVTSYNGIAICGSLFDAVLNSNDLFILKVNGTGVKQWDLLWGGDGDEAAMDIIETMHQDIAITGYTDSDYNGLDQVLILETNSTGSEKWNMTYGTLRAWEAGSRICETSNNGNLYVSGYTMSMPGVGMDLLLLRTGVTGTSIWMNTYGGSGNERDPGLYVDTSGVILTGSTTSYGSGGDDIFLVRTDLDGNELYYRYYGSANTDYGLDTLPGKFGFFAFGISMGYGPGPSVVALLNLTDALRADPGVYRSSDLLEGLKVNELKELGYTVDIPTGCTIDISFSKNLYTWTDNKGVEGNTVKLTGGSGKISLVNLVGYSDRFHYSLSLQCENGTGASFNKGSLAFFTRSTTGQMVSPPVDGGENVIWGKVSFDTLLPEGTYVNITSRSAADEASLSSAEFVGPDGSPGSVYTSGDLLWEGHSGHRWFQLRADLSTDSISETPKLLCLNFTYDRPGVLAAPAVSQLSGDIEDRFNFTVTYIDLDNDPLGVVSVEIDGINLTMERADPADTMSYDGIDLFYETELPAGTHTFRFCSYIPGEEAVSPGGTVIVSPGPLRSIVVLPSNTTVTSDEYVQFTAEGFDRAGNELPISPEWENNGGGFIDSFGNFTAERAGKWTVNATVGGVRGSAGITILHGALARITVSAPDDEISADATFMFSALGYDSDDNPFGISPEWSVDGGGVIGENGLFDPSTVGTWTVFANSSGFSGWRTIRVVAGNLSLIALGPTEAVLNISQQISFMADGFDSDGNEVEFVPSWDVSGGGIISRDGIFTATTAGNWTVYCNASGISSTAVVRVNAPSSGDDDDDDDDDTTPVDVSDDGGEFPWWAIAVVAAVLLIVIAVLAVLLLKRKRDIVPATVEAPGQPQLGTAPIQPAPLEGATVAELPAATQITDGPAQPVPSAPQDGPADAMPPSPSPQGPGPAP